MHKTNVLVFAAAILAVTAGPANAHQVPPSGCERTVTQTIEGLIDEAADFEGMLFELESLCRGGRCFREAQTIHADFTLYVDDLLERRASTTELIRAFAALTTRQTLLRARALGVPQSAPESRPQTIMSFAADPKKLPSNQPVDVGNFSSVVRSVTFAPISLIEFWGLALQLQAKFLRAIFKGIVGPVNEAGVKRLNDISKYFIEVKIYGPERLFGCLRDGKLTITGLSLKHPDSETLAKYGALCD